jgi:hypothetical protein
MINATKTNIIGFKIHRRNKKKRGESDTHVLLSIILIHEFSQNKVKTKCIVHVHACRYGVHSHTH